MTQILPLQALRDNYIWLIRAPQSDEVAVVDPGDAAPVLNTLKEQNLKLTCILITHHHWDHTNGIPELIKHYPGLVVYGPAQEKVNGVTHPLKEGDQITLREQNLSLKILDIPGHTLGHIAYYNDELLFCGDTLFSSGCGRVFEGTHEQMYHSLEKLRALNSKIEMYCGHEYTLANLQFALSIEPDNADLLNRVKEVKQITDAGQASLPVSLGQEKRTNPFFRCHEKDFAKQLAKHLGLENLTSPADVFTHLRQYKDQY